MHFFITDPIINHDPTKICIYILKYSMLYKKILHADKNSAEIMSRRPNNNLNVGERCCRATVLSRATYSPSLCTLISNTAVCRHLPVSGNCRAGIHVCCT